MCAITICSAKWACVGSEHRAGDFAIGIFQVVRRVKTFTLTVVSAEHTNLKHKTRKINYHTQIIIMLGIYTRTHTHMHTRTRIYTYTHTHTYIHVHWVTCEVSPLHFKYLTQKVLCYVQVSPTLAAHLSAHLHKRMSKHTCGFFAGCITGTLVPKLRSRSKDGGMGRRPFCFSSKT